MKLILCINCSDVFKLSQTIDGRTCACGKSWGRYIDNLNAEYSGKYAIPIGFSNTSLISAIPQQPTHGMGQPFEAFIIPKKCNTFIKVKR